MNDGSEFDDIDSKLDDLMGSTEDELNESDSRSDELDYDVTAIIQLKVDGSTLPDVTNHLQEHTYVVAVYETTGNHDIIMLGKFVDTDHMNDQIKELLVDPDINETSTSVVLNTVVENEQFDPNY